MDTLRPSYRFVPTDQVLFDYLQYKILYPNVDLQTRHVPILDYDIYQSEPENLPAPETIGAKISQKYYAVQRRRSGNRGTRPMRDVGDYGWWRSSSTKEFHDEEGNYIGSKTVLTYFKYKDGVKSTKDGVATNWIMHEYSYHPSSTEFEQSALCRIKLRVFGEEESK